MLARILSRVENFDHHNVRAKAEVKFLRLGSHLWRIRRGFAREVGEGVQGLNSQPDYQISRFPVILNKERPQARTNNKQRDAACYRCPYGSDASIQGTEHRRQNKVVKWCEITRFPGVVVADLSIRSSMYQIQNVDLVCKKKCPSHHSLFIWL